MIQFVGKVPANKIPISLYYDSYCILIEYYSNTAVWFASIKIMGRESERRFKEVIVDYFIPPAVT
jgi:hypothetical protein